ncbi:MAG: AAA family ATPase [Polyangiaceae bacterium]|nr:AAA family ATPase [Polyangiaceae bacterium]
MAIKASVINFKGGVGKTTLAFHLSAHLARTHRVLMIDVDHQSSLSAVVLSARLWQQCQQSGLTSNRIFEAYCNRRVLAPGAEIIFKNPLHARQPKYNFYPNLDIVPAQFELDDTEIEMANTSIGGSTVAEWDKRTLLAEWLDRANADTNYDYIIFDCPPATKLVSQNALAASKYFVVPVIPDDLSTRGVAHFLTLVSGKIDARLEHLRTAAPIAPSSVPKNYVTGTKLAAIVPFMAKSAGRAKSGMTNIHTRNLTGLKIRYKNDVIGTTIKHMTGIPESTAMGWPVWNVQGQTANISPAVIKMMSDACSAVAQRLV